MHLLTLPLSSNSHVYVEGDVSIDPGAAIASGVILRADPDSKIIIAAGVCIGMGSILHAHQGVLEVEAGANLGTGVLVVGKGRIGSNACVGAATTIWNSSLGKGQVVPAGSVVGAQGRQITEISSSSIAPAPSISDVLNTPDSSTSTLDKNSLNGKAASTQAEVPTGTTTDTTDEDPSTEPQAEIPNSETEDSVYGQGNLNRLLKTLFPYNQSLNQALNLPPQDT